MSAAEKSPLKNTFMKGKNLAIVRTVSYFITSLSLGLTVAVLGPTLPGLAEQTGVNIGRISFLFTAHSLGYLLGSLVGGRLYDRISGRFVIASALFTIMVMMLLVPFVPLLYVLIVVLVVNGSASGMLDVGCNTLLVWVHGSKVASYMNALHFFFGLGAFISPLIVGRVIRSTGGISWAYWVLALILLPSTVLLSSISAPEIKKHNPDKESRRSDYFLVAIISFFFFLHVGGELAYGGWIYTYALSVGLADKIVAAYLTSVFWGSLTVGRLSGVPVASRVKPHYILIYSLVGCVIGPGIILLFSSSAAVMWIGTAITGFSMASLFPVSITFAERHLHLSGKVTSMFLAGASVGTMFFPLLVGQFFESVGPHVTMIIITIDYVLALGVFLFAVNYTRKK
jgi:FHS family Na+ dependent glucose MFS transporter 1